ncbi:MAG: hypothetical protein KGN76_12795 [Acidobacteriota bacterium]|nr:hypothetical protein [Acidobacteriota bacterium]
MERVICVPLSDAEWRAFLAIQPQPVAWLQQQIRQQVQVAATREPQPSQTVRSAAVN